MTTLLIIWAIFSIVFLAYLLLSRKGLSERNLLIDKSFTMDTHNWIEKDGIKQNTKMYEFENGMSATHDKDLNRLYVYNPDGFPAQEPIDTTSITVQEFEETLLGIEKR